MRTPPLLADFIHSRANKTNKKKKINTLIGDVGGGGKIKKNKENAQRRRGGGRGKSIELLEQRIRKEGVVKPWAAF